jgi:hypothetical protein
MIVARPRDDDRQRAAPVDAAAPTAGSRIRSL